VIELENHSEIAVPQQFAPGGRELVDAVAVELNFTGVGRIERA
jgi:hypothetical protein